MNVIDLGLSFLDWKARCLPQYTACYRREGRSNRITGMFAIWLCDFIGSMFSPLTTDPSDRSLSKRIIKLSVVTACTAYVDAFGVSYFSSSGRAHLYRAVVLGLYTSYTDPAISKIGDMIFNKKELSFDNKLKGIKAKVSEGKVLEALYVLGCDVFCEVIGVFLNRVWLPHALPKYLPNLSSPIWTAVLCHSVHVLVQELLQMAAARSSNADFHPFAFPGK